MKVTELLEDEQKMVFKVVFKLPRLPSRTQRFTHKTIGTCKVLSNAEVKRALKLQVGSTLTTQFTGPEGRTMVYITREK